MTATTYPRIDARDPRFVFPAAGEVFYCLSSADATLALRALQDAFAAGQRSMIERKDDDTARA